MANRNNALEKLQEYATRVAETRYEIKASTGNATHAARLESAFQELTDQVKKEKEMIDHYKTRHVDETFEKPSSDPHRHLQQLRVIKTAYEGLAAAEPTLPSRKSPLPALLALRSTQCIISETEESILDVRGRLKNARDVQAKEEADLKDAHLITEALENRIARLRIELEEKSQKTPDEAARAMIEEQEKRKTSYEKETKKLVRALLKFINQRLAGMLAVEELGGPVVGNLLDVSDEMLDAGFSQQGKAKKKKTHTNVEDDKRQRRIDQIWGQQDEDDEGMLTHSRSEKEAAAAEMRSLTEDLLNLAAEEGSAAYVALQRDSAAARFLVRAKVAQFHPRDAGRLRLVDFGRELDD